MTNRDLKYNRRLLNALFCIDEDFISYEDLLSGKYDKTLRLHMDTDSVEINNTFSPSEFVYLKHQIEKENEFRKVMFNI